jgi:hypothetical protein
MKWFFALSEASLSNGDLYANCIRVAVISANRNTSLTPFFLYDGGENPFVEEMRSLGVNIIHHRTTLYDIIVARKPDDRGFIKIASGAFLRIDIPIIEKNDEFVLYTDCDVMFLKDPDLENLKPKYFSVAPQFTRGDYNDMNSGVMLINVPEMRLIHEEFVQHIKKFRTFELPAYDQSALRAFFKGNYDRLPETLNWKPYWGKNQDAEIIHFHGPKPPHAKALMNNVGDSLPQQLKGLYQRAPDYYQETVDLWYAFLAEASR